MTTGVLVDTSAWIDFFRRTEGEVGDTVADLVEQDQAVMTGPILAELLRGVRSAKEGGELRVLLEALPYVEVKRPDWQAAGESLRELRSRGLTLALTDAVIAAVASRNGLPILTLDKDFEHLSVTRV